MADLLTVAEVTEWMKAQGNAGDLGNAAMVQTYIDAVTPVIENLSRPVTSASSTFTLNGGSRALVLPVPVISVTAVVEAGATLAVDAYTVDAPNGIVWRGGTSSAATWAAGTSNVVVTATVGVDAVPGNVKLAALELFKHLWAGRNGPRPAFGNQPGQDQPYAPSGFAVPHKVAELLAATPRLPGFA